MNPRTSVLVVDDERFVRESLAEVLAAEGWQVLTAENATAAARVIEESDLDAIVTDLKMPSGDGLSLLALANERGVAVPIVVITGHGTVAEAVAAMKAGAFDFLQKPVDPEELVLLVRRAIEHHGLLAEVRRLRERMRQREPRVLVGSSPALAAVRAEIARVAKSDAPVLITGESGTGKELAASEIHRLSAHADAPSVRVDCAAISEEMFESELFGHRRGSFPGAAADRAGRFAEAEGGTLVLDEVGALKPGQQAKLLRVLESGEYQVVGDPRRRYTTARVIATSNQGLGELVQQGALRADLYYRLARFPITMPPLRAHMEDLPEIAEHLIARAQYKERAFESTTRPRLSAEALEVLGSYGWPGNVRELRNVIERALILAGEAPITTELLQGILESALPSRPAVDAGDLHLRRNLDAAEKELVLRALARSQGKKKEAALMLGVDPRNLGYYLRKHKITDA
jgi:DNA-binding NtrC family response regulator